jgi:adenine-specific DNA-methyltransferase
MFGEPDIEIRPAAPADASGAASDAVDQIEVEILGVYDPSTDEVRSRNTDHIALWMLDTKYNEESLFVRHCYRTGGNDPYARLKRALTADIDEDAWASIYSTVSRPFPKPETGKIAVKSSTTTATKSCRSSTSDSQKTGTRFEPRHAR